MGVNIKELKELEVKATKGTWSYIDEWSGIYDAPDMRGAQVRVAEIIRTPDYTSNAKLIAASRNALPELIRVIELAEEALNQVNDKSHFVPAIVQDVLAEIKNLKGE